MLEGKTALHAIGALNGCNAFYQVKNRIGQCGVYCFNAGVAFAGCRQVYFDFGLSAGWIDYQFVLAFQVILQHIGTRQSGIFRAAAVSGRKPAAPVPSLPRASGLFSASGFSKTHP